MLKTSGRSAKNKFQFIFNTFRPISVLVRSPEQVPHVCHFIWRLTRYPLISLMVRPTTWRRTTNRKGIEGTVMQIKNNCYLIAVGEYPETFAFQLFIFLYLFFVKLSNFLKNRLVFLKNAILFNAFCLFRLVNKI